MRALRLLLSAAVASAGVFSLGVPSAYAVGCYGETCNNKGPVAMGCTRDQRLITNPEQSNLQVRFSPACNAAWAWSDWTPTFNSVWIEIERARSDKIVHDRLSIELATDEEVEWTNMLGGQWHFRAVWNDRALGGNDNYTEWVYR
jgi:hypothetical protein